LNYKEFLTKFNIKDFDYKFCLDSKQKKKFEKYDQFFLNSLAFVPLVKKENKSIVLHNFLNNKVEKVFVLEKIEEIFDLFDKKYNDQRIKIREFAKYVFDWIEINKKEKYRVKIIANNLKKTENEDFVFYIVYRFYNLALYEEVVKLISYLGNFFNKDSKYYNDLLLYKLIALKNDEKYINDKRILRKVCKIAKKLYGFDYVKVITLLECALLQNNIKNFREIIKKYYNLISGWDVIDILDIYELSIYTRDENIIFLIKRILDSKDIEILFGNEIIKIYWMFIEAIRKKNLKEAEKIKKELEKKGYFNFYYFEKFKDMLK